MLLLFSFCTLILLSGLLANPVPAYAQDETAIDWAYYEEKGLQPLEARSLVNEGGESILDFIPATGLLLIPESSNEKVMAFDPQDGSLVDEFFFPGDSDNLTTPIQIRWNFFGTSFLISDQLMRLVQQFDTDGNFEQTFAPIGGENSDILNNIRGTYMKPNGNLLVTVAGGGNANSVAMFDTDGEYLGNFIDNNVGGLNGPWSIAHRQAFNDYLVTASGSNAVHRYDADGDFIEMFATGLNFPQQITELNNGNLLVATFSAPAGVYEFDSDGNQVGYYGVMTGLRGVYELGNENIIVTNSSGVHIINRNNQLVETVIGGQARHITFVQPMDMDFFELNLEMQPEDAGTLLGAGTYPEDFMVSIHAIPNLYHEFVNWTDSDGVEVSSEASFQFLMPAEDVTLTAHFNELDTYTAHFTVAEDSADEDPVEGATIAIEGFDDLVTDTGGEASIELPVGSYTAHITKQGYVSEEVAFNITDGDIQIDVHLVDVILAPANLEVITEDMPVGEALFTWTDPADIHEFRYDDGVVDGQLGFQGTWNSVMGAVHFNDAILEEMTWYLTSEGGPHSTVKVWVLGLDANGLPDRNNIVYTSENVPNTDNQWNTYVFPIPIEMSDGFFIGLSYNGFLGLATDDGVGEPWDFVPGTQFGVFNITDPTSEFTDISFWGFEVNFLLRAYGLNFGEVGRGTHAGGSPQGPAPQLIPMDKPVEAGSPKPVQDGNKAFLGFNVYLNDNLVAEEIHETEYHFTDLPPGDHTAGVQTAYTTGSSDIVTIDFHLEGGHEVVFFVDITDAVLQGQLQGFDVEEDHILITGSMLGWAEPGAEETVMELYSTDPYVYTMSLVLAPGPYEYKYFSDFIGEGWDGGEWPGDPNRTIEVTDDMVVHDIFEVGDPNFQAVTFHVDLTRAMQFGLLEGFDPEVHHILITGDMVGWAEPGSDPDNQVMEWLTADPMVFGITHHLAEGTYEYKYFSDLLGDGWDGGEWPGDPNRVVEVTGEMTVEDHFGPDDLSVIGVADHSILLYPNPAHSVLNIRADTEITGVRLIDMLGQVVLDQVLNSRTHQLNVSEYRHGMYFIQLSTREGVATYRVHISR